MRPFFLFHFLHDGFVKLKSSLAHAEGENKVKMSKREKRTIVIGTPPN